MKPFGKSFKKNRSKGKNTRKKRRRNSIWKYDPPSVIDKLLNYTIKLTKFSQANFTSLAKGGVTVVCVSLYPLEKCFFNIDIKSEFFKDLILNFVTGLGKKRIDAIQSMQDYFEDLNLEYDFYKQLDGKTRLRDGKFRYKIINNFAEIGAIREQDELKNVTTICVILTIEGMHVLNSNADKVPTEAVIMGNLKKLKAWVTPPFFVSIAHHFKNHLCGHAQSLDKKVEACIDKNCFDKNTGFKPLGEKVVKELLNNKNGKRILIDVKHMSVASRRYYYDLLETTDDYKGIPIIVSHGAANGLKSFDEKVSQGSEFAASFNTGDINFFNEELIKIAKSKGIFCLQLDERRVASENTIKKVKHSIIRSKIMHYRSKLLWNQIQHIVEVLDVQGLPAWDCIALGTDYDGIIDPLNAFWTSEELPYLADFLERHAHNYMRDASFNVPENKIKTDEIISRIMSTNGMKFIEAYYK